MNDENSDRVFNIIVELFAMFFFAGITKTLRMKRHSSILQSDHSLSNRFPRFCCVVYIIEACI